MEKTPSGSVVLRHRGNGLRSIEASSELAADAAKTREAIYDRFFGTCETVYHEVLPSTPHIDVYAYPAQRGWRDFCTLVTGGMSDLPMSVRPEAEGVACRVELIFYCSAPKPEYLEGLRPLAAFRTL